MRFEPPQTEKHAAAKMIDLSSDPSIMSEQSYLELRKKFMREVKEHKEGIQMLRKQAIELANSAGLN